MADVSLVYEYTGQTPNSPDIDFTLTFPYSADSGAAELKIYDHRTGDYLYLQIENDAAKVSSFVEGLIALGRALDREWQPRRRQPFEENLSRRAK